MSFDNNEYSAEQVLAEVNESGTGITSTLSEAVKRIEEANLLKTLVNADIFAPDSAAPEVLASVKQRLQAWALNELEILLGMKQPAQAISAATAAKSQFDEEEVLSLRKLAAKMLNRDSSSVTLTPREPAIVQIGSQQKEILKNPIPAQPKAKASAPAPKAAAKPKGTLAQVKQADGTYRDVDHGKKTTRANGVTPLPMPSAAQAQTIASTQAANGATQMGNVLANPIPDQHINKSVSSLISAAIHQATGGNQVAVLADNSSESGDVNDRF